VPDAGNLAADEQHREVAGLAGRDEGAGGGRAGEQPVPGLAADHEGVEVGQEQHPARRRPGVGDLGVAGRHPGRRPVEVDLGQLAPVLAELVGRPGRGRADPLGELPGGGRPVGVEVPAEQLGHRFGFRGRREAGQPAAGVGVGDPAAAVPAEAQDAAVGGGADRLAPARPQVLEGRHDPLPGPRTGKVHHGLGQLVDGQLGLGQGGTDGADHLVGLVGGQPHPVREGALGRDGRQRARPDGEVPGRQQVDRAPGAVGLDQAAVLPQGAADIGAGGAIDT
jgi:hypothetical protein